MNTRVILLRRLTKTGLVIGLILPLGAVLYFWLTNSLNAPLGNLFTQDAPMLCLALGRLAGLIALYGILVQMTLIGRGNWIEQRFGLDRLTRVHHILGISLAVFLVSHPLLLTFSYSQQNSVSWVSQDLDFIRNWEDVGAAMAGLLVIFATLAASHSWIRRKLSYEVWHLIHLLIYIGVGLSIEHQFQVGGDLTGNKFFKLLWIALYILCGANLFFFRFFRPAFRFLKHRFYIDDLRAENGDVTSLTLRGRAMETFPVKAGQFLIVRFLAKGFWREAHPFSVSANPDGMMIRLSIKKCGDFTARVPNLQKGTRVLIDGPYGVFTSDSLTRDKILMIAGGIGITPIRSLLEELLKKGRAVELIYANRTQGSLVFDKELRDLAGAYPRFHLVPIFSHEPAWAGETGHLDQAKIGRLVPNIQERDIFLCGPPPMMKGVLSALSALGVPRRQIHHERFAL